MKKWEYKIYYRANMVGLAHDQGYVLQFEGELDSFGKDGWELVNFISQSGSNAVYIFKRTLE